MGTATRKPHRKSRHGCVNCKRRKIKCDEERPDCRQCVRFGVQCSFSSGLVIRSEPGTVRIPDKSEECPPEVRGRGRPRKNWTAVLETEDSSPARASSTATSHTTERFPGCPQLNLEDAELLLHFVQVTSYTLTGREPDNPRTQFWTHNLPRMGLAHHFVMHLMYAVAGYHLAYLDKTGERRRELRGRAERHAAEGLKRFTAALTQLDEANCGAAYISATLVCYCTFAAGPTGPGDLLVCNLEIGRAHV